MHKQVEEHFDLKAEHQFYCKNNSEPWNYNLHAAEQVTTYHTLQNVVSASAIVPGQLFNDLQNCDQWSNINYDNYKFY